MTPHAMDYSFQPYLEALDRNWYDDDELLGRLLARYRRGPEPSGDGGSLSDWGATVGGELNRLAETSAASGDRPALCHYDPYGRRVDRVLLPSSTHAALAEVGGRQRLGAVHGDPFEFYARLYLYQQNGEAGVACAMACTDGLVRALEALGDGEVHREALERVRASTAERLYHGAQFVTEIQGGSDVGANATRAVPDGERYRLHGNKWFCSNVNADYFLVTARPEGAPEGGPGVALFLVPAYSPDGEWLRNGYTIDRLKQKLGTRELATAELTFAGAAAYPVGRLERGLANLVRHVLVPSRFACVISAAAFLRRAERIVEAYTEFRSAFGVTLIRYPPVAETVARIAGARRRALAAQFRLLDLWERAEKAGDAEAAQDFRVMLSLCKPVLTSEATRLLHEAMMLLGGNGIEERFSPLPRLYRDSVIMETWEGPHNVLFAQALSDLARGPVDPPAFVERIAGDERPRLAEALERVLADAAEPRTALAFARLAPELVGAFAERGLDGPDR